MIVAIDGPAGSGKSTIAKNTAHELGFRYLDTGAMYRAIAARALELGVSFDDCAALTRIAQSDTIEFGFTENEPLPSRVLIAGEDVTERIRTPEVDRAVSPISAHRPVREALLVRQRQMAQHTDYVVEGRDIGTVVFPDAPVKVFLTASPQERARRRAAQNLERGLPHTYDEILADITARDAYDSTRETSPLVAADDAVILDSTMMTIEYVTERIAELVRAAQERP